MPIQRALLILDMQVGLFHGPEQPWQGERVLNNINRLIKTAHAAQAPIFAARHTGPQGSPIEAGSALWQLLPTLVIDPQRDRLFDKTRPSAFYGTPLREWLQQAAVEEVVIAGMKTQYCVDTTCRIAAELGVRPVLVSDAHTCMDTPGLSAEAIVAHHNLTLAGAFATVCATEAVQF
ncbi:cysteine hydrolase family protein [Pseudomonas aegrilactucae]|uniref:Cysteine hydrolase n=1 Tax=Pseudomonas aegrilactucae TaxID=2854028 RepID=A0A9Q2XKW5_9PSED|nr:cysteine hydrolase family protein [Pseudomonas aegrilactucae]MBV6288072.1 cysteine hydrolase [Pseudomonas aegrilactucae]